MKTYSASGLIINCNQNNRRGFSVKIKKKRETQVIIRYSSTQLTGTECIIASTSEFSSQTVIYIIHQSLVFHVQKINPLDILQLW